ncbi:MAG: amidohydrolase, partial [Gammaproteobacteria bacterium]|nr:amidohydrolase [Gammaproteobacteria bacterium]
MTLRIASLVALALLFQACDQSAGSDAKVPFASRYAAMSGEKTLLTGATVLTGNGERLDDADVLFDDGRI